MDQIFQQIIEHQEQLAVKTSMVLPMTTDDEYDHALLGDTWQDLDIEVTLDSGCVEHVLDAGETPGYCIVASPGSERRQNYVVGNGHKIPNQGEIHLNLEKDIGGNSKQLSAVFQVAAIRRPLMSASKICDQDLVCTFDKTKATVSNERGEVVCEFLRRGGRYVANMKLKRPMLIDPGSTSPPRQVRQAGCPWSLRDP